MSRTRRLWVGAGLWVAGFHCFERRPVTLDELLFIAVCTVVFVEVVDWVERWRARK